MSATEFWNWFEHNNKPYLFINEVDEAEREKLLDQLLDRLHSHCPNLFFAIGGSPGEDQGLIISAEGNVGDFHKVEALVAEAPNIKYWQVIAFKPAQGFHFKLKHGSILFDPSTIWFLPMESRSRQNYFGIRVGFKAFDPSRKKDFLSGTYLMLSDALGERQAAEDIQHVEVCQLPDDPERHGYLELKELTDYLTWWKNGSEGNETKY